MAQENQLPIYRVNKEHEKLHQATTFDQVVNLVMRSEQERLERTPISKRQEGDAYVEKTLNDDLELSGYSVRVFHKARVNPNPWNGFFQDVVQDLRQLRNESHDFIVFISDEQSENQNIYCFTGGSAFHVISDFADEDFPIQLLVRFIDPEKIKTARSRMLTGSFYARSNFFRGAHSISVADAFGAIWKDVTATLKDEVRADPDFSYLFESKRDLNCEAKSSFKLKKRVGFEQGLTLISKLETILSRELTADESMVLDLFETFQIIKSKPKKDEVKERILSLALSYINDETSEFDFDVCNVEYEKYFEAEKYVVAYKQHRFEFTSHPSGKDILDELKNLEESPTSTQELANIKINTESSLGEWHTTKGTLYDHLHGEVELNNDEKYFLIDKNLYKAKADFLEKMNQNFISRLNTDDLLLHADNSSQFIDWGNISEGEYNELYLQQPSFVVADRVTLKGIEVFDLLYFGQDNKIYIVQVKNGLGSSTRDACSQIRNSADVIENAINDGQTEKLRELYRLLSRTTKVSYHADLQRIMRTFTEDEFLNLFRNNERIYLLLFKYRANNADLSRLASNIAKFEILSTADYMRMHNADFKMLNIAS